MKYYLVACYDDQDCIDNLQQMFLKLSADIHTKGKYQVVKDQKQILSQHEAIHFLPAVKLELVTYYGDFQFDGMAMSYKCREFCTWETKQFYDAHFRKMKRSFGMNPGGQFLRKYLKR